MRTLQHYTEWMKRLLTFIPDGRFKLKSFATDDERNNVSAYAVFRGTDTGEGAVPINGQDRLVRLRVRDVLRRRQDHAHAKDLACRPDDGAEN